MTISQDDLPLSSETQVTAEYLLAQPLPPDASLFPSDVVYQPSQIPFWIVYKTLNPDRDEVDFATDLLEFDESTNTDFREFDYTVNENYQNTEWQAKWLSFIIDKYPPDVSIYGENLTATGSNTLMSMLQMEFVVKGNKAITDEMEDLYSASELSSKLSQGLNALLTYYNNKPKPTLQEETPQVPLAEKGSNGEILYEDYIKKVWVKHESNLDAEDYAKVFGDDREYYLDTNHLAVNPDDCTTDGTNRQLNLYEYLTVIQKEISDLGADALAGQVQKILTRLEPYSEKYEETILASSVYIPGGYPEEGGYYIQPHYEDTYTTVWKDKLPEWKTDWAHDTDVGIDIQNAQLSAEHTNSTVKTELRRAMWNFEEFYKSASKMLAKLRTVFRNLTKRIKT